MSSRRTVTVGLALMVLATSACTGAKSARLTASGSLSLPATGPSMTTVGDAPGIVTTSPGRSYSDIAPGELGFVTPARLPGEVALFSSGPSSRRSEVGEVVEGDGEPRYEVLAACLGAGGPVTTRYEMSKDANADGVAHGGPNDTSGSIACDGSVKRIEVSGLPSGPMGIELVDPPDQGVRGYAILLRLGEGAPR